MPKDIYEMYMELDDKWSIENLRNRVKDRVKDHLRTNTITRDHMLKQIDIIASEAKLKNKK